MLNFLKEEGVLRCIFSGRIDTEAAVKIENELFDAVIKSKDPVIFDLKDVDYVSSAFLRICVKAARASHGTRITIINASRSVAEVYKQTGLDRIFSMNK